MTTLAPLISFEDAVTAKNLNPNQTVAVFYTDGRYANQIAVHEQCPRAALYGITVRGMTGKGIFACDCELGDLTVTQAETWVVKQIKLKVELICVYASEDRWVNQGLLAAIDAIEKKYGVTIKKWVAWYTGIKSIPSWADAEQYADPGPVDLNVARANFFKGVTPVPAPPVVKSKSVPPRPAQTRPVAQPAAAKPLDWFNQQLKIVLAQLAAAVKKLSTGRKS